MKNTLKAATLERKFPLLNVEHDCILSKDADLTVGYRVSLPELFTITAAEYEAMHAAWTKAVKVLPNFSIVHKQDWFIEESYAPDTEREDMSFLSQSFERHFNERPYLNHTCYLFITKTTKEHSRTTSAFNALTRGFIIPKQMQDQDAVQQFVECCEQFEQIMNECGFIRLQRLTDAEIIGTPDSAGILEKYFSLLQTDTTCLQDLTLGADEMRIGDNRLCLHTLSDTDDLPGRITTNMRYERLSTDRSDCRLSFAAPIGVLLPCNHIVNQYLFIDDSAENLARFEKKARNMHSLSRYSRANQINREWRTLVAEFGDQRFGFRQMFPQPCVRFQLVEVFGQPVLECLQFLFVDAGGLAQQVEALRSFHLARFGDASAQHLRRDELVIAVRLHLDMLRCPEKHHDFRGEPLDTNPCKRIL